MRLLTSALVLTMLLAATGAHAKRRVVVNGLRLHPAQIQLLETVACGPIPNGNYWLDTASGVLGYAGDSRPRGDIRDNCVNSGRRPSVSERGLRDSPGEVPG